MKRIIIRDFKNIPPFGEPARELRIMNKPLWLLQRDLLKGYCKTSVEIESYDEIAEQVPVDDEELIVYRDNLFFNADLIDAFIVAARAYGRPCQIAFLATSEKYSQKGDLSIEKHALQLQEGIQRRDDARCMKDGAETTTDVYIADIYYFPGGKRGEPKPLVIDTMSGEMGYYRIPSYMAQRGDLVYQVPIRAFLSVENWVHLFFANTPFGVFSWGRSQELQMSRGRLKDFTKWTSEDWTAFRAKLGLSFTAFLERLNPFEEKWRNHFLASKKLVKVGKNCSIDPTAIIHGPTVIGDNVYIGPGTVIANSLIGNNVNIMQGSQVMLSVVSDRCFLPFNGALFMTTLMDNSMVAQNSTLQLCVVGRNTFIGANNCFTDFNLLGEPIKVLHNGVATEVNMPVLGSGVGHNVKIGSGFIVYPGRMIGSNTVIIFNNDMNLIRKGTKGLSPDDVDEATGEPRRVVYHWPNIYNPESHDNGPPALPEANGHDHSQPMMMQMSAPPVRVNATLGGKDL